MNPPAHAGPDFTYHKSEVPPAPPQAVIPQAAAAPAATTTGTFDGDMSGGPLPANDLASAYQPRRVFAATVSIAWNLLLAALFLAGGAASELLTYIAPATQHAASTFWQGPLYFAILFTGYAVLNLPLELWFGYLGERQFALAKDGIRAWARDWLIATTQHGVMFVLGASLILLTQSVAQSFWLPLLGAALLILFLATTWLSADFIPPGLFSLQSADEPTAERLRALLPGSLSSSTLPPILIHSHPTLREYAGGVVGLANRQKYLISRSTLTSASDALLRFVLLHDLGHKRYHHNLLAALAGWAWVSLGLTASHWLIPTATFATPLYIAWLTLTFSAWMALGEPLLAWLGRRLEYQADRFYLVEGGTLDEMRAALCELARRNLARTEPLQRRHTIFHPLPSVSNRLHAAAQFARTRTGQED